MTIKKQQSMADGSIDSDDDYTANVSYKDTEEMNNGN